MIIMNCDKLDDYIDYEKRCTFFGLLMDTGIYAAFSPSSRELYFFLFLDGSCAGKSSTAFVAAPVLSEEEGTNPSPTAALAPMVWDLREWDVSYVVVPGPVLLAEGGTDLSTTAALASMVWKVRKRNICNASVLDAVLK